MAKATLKEHTVDIGGIEHTLLLDSEDAERYGEAAVVVVVKKAAAVPANKAASAPENK